MNYSIIYLLQMILVVSYILLFIFFIRCISRKTSSSTNNHIYRIFTVAAAIVFVICSQLLLQSAIYTENSAKDAALPTSFPLHNQQDRNENIITFLSDIDHDGTKESLVIDLTLIPTEQTASLSVRNENGETIWSDIAGLPHVGWNSYYLYSNNSKDYLLQYNPTMYQGDANYTYDLFYLDAKGNRQSVDSGQITFSINPGSKELYNSQDLAAFANTANSYLDNSFLLLSTEEGNLEYSTPEHIVTRRVTFSWLDEDGKNLIDSLEEYRNELINEDD